MTDDVMMMSLFVVQMSLCDAPLCILMKLRPMAARKSASMLRSQFKLNNRRFLNVEGRSKSGGNCLVAPTLGKGKSEPHS